MNTVCISGKTTGNFQVLSGRTLIRVLLLRTGHNTPSILCKCNYLPLVLKILSSRHLKPLIYRFSNDSYHYTCNKINHRYSLPGSKTMPE